MKPNYLIVLEFMELGGKVDFDGCLFRIMKNDDEIPQIAVEGRSYRHHETPYEGSGRAIYPNPSIDLNEFIKMCDGLSEDQMAHIRNELRFLKD